MCVCYIMVIYTHPNTGYPKVSTLIKLSTGVQLYKGITKYYGKQQIALRGDMLQAKWFT